MKRGEGGGDEAGGGFDDVIITAGASVTTDSTCRGTVAHDSISSDATSSADQERIGRVETWRTVSSGVVVSGTRSCGAALSCVHMDTYRDGRDERIARLEAENAALRGGGLTSMDWIALVIVGVGALALVGFAFVSRAYGAMYRDFAAVLPFATRIAVKPWAGPIAALVPVTIVASVFRQRRSLAMRRGTIAVAFAIELIILAGLTYALYEPLVALSSSVS